MSTLMVQLAEARANLTELKILAHRERKRMKRVTIQTRQDLQAAEAAVAKLQEQINQGATWISPTHSSAR